MSILIAVVNESTVLTDEQAKPVVDALQKQVTVDFLPVWHIDAQVQFHAKGSPIPPGAWQLVLFDDSDQADALGYHELTASGLPIGKVFADTDLQNGSSWSVTMSHELLEMLVDPDINLCAIAGDTVGTIYAYEVCDAVEADALGYDIDGVRVSDFVAPSWFMPNGAAPFDMKGHLMMPFQLAIGGYISTATIATGWEQLTNESLIGAEVPYGTRRARRRLHKTQWKRSLK